MRLESLVSQLLGNAARSVRTGDPAIDSAIYALSSLQEHAVAGRWLQTARLGLSCSVHFGRPGGPVLSCSSPAIGMCLACGQPACFEHAMVSVNGELVCRTCIHVQLLQGRPPATQSPPPPPSPATSQQKDETAAVRRRYLKLLGLKGRPTAEQVKTAYKKRAAQSHPDKFPEQKKAAATARFVELGKARDWLLADVEREAA